MPIFNNELLGSAPKNIDESGLPNVGLASPILDTPERYVAPDISNFGFNKEGSTGLTIDQLSQIAHMPTDLGRFDSPESSIPRSELFENKRYPLYQRDVDLENIYGIQQGALEQLGNSAVKFLTTTAGTFAQSLSNIPNTIDAVRNKDFSKLSGDPNGYEGGIADWMKNMNDVFPNYVSKQERENPWLGIIPFAPGSANFWGENILVNLGFTAGSIAGAVAQDAAVGLVTGGIGEIPLVASQIGKAALYLNKIFANTNKLDRILDLGTTLGKTEQQLMNVKNMAQLAASTKVMNGFRYGTALVGASMTEAKVESIDSYKTLVEELKDQYKFDNYGEEPDFKSSKQIESYATDAMNTRFGLNMALLTVSNGIQFDNLFKSFTSANKIINSGLTREIETAGKIGLKEGSIDVFEKKIPLGIGAKVWDAVKPSAANVFREGVFEEGSQFAVERGVYDYYTRKYKNLSDPKNAKNWNTLNEVMRSTTQGLADQFGSEEGIKSMIIGGISGVISGGIMGRIDAARGEGKDARLQSAVNLLNTHGFTGMLSDKYDETLSSVNVAQEMEEAAKSGNIYQFKNLKHDMFFNFVNSRLRLDMHDVTIEQLEMLKDLSKEEFEKQFNIDFNETNQKTVSGYIDAMITEADNIKELNDSIGATFNNPYKRIDNPKTPEEAEQFDRYRAFEDWKTNLTYYASVLPDIDNRLSSIQTDLTSIAPQLSNDTVAQFFDAESATELANFYKQSADTIEAGITNLTVPTDKKKINKQVKDLRKASEMLSSEVEKGEDFDIKKLDWLMNFELNGQSSTKPKVIPPTKINDVYNYGVDINRLNAKRQRTSDIYDALSSKEGFDKFFKQSEEMKKKAQDAIDAFLRQQEILANATQGGEKTPEQLKEEFETEKKRRSDEYEGQRDGIAAELETTPNPALEDLINAETKEEFDAAFEKLSDEDKEKYADFRDAANDHFEFQNQTFEDNLAAMQETIDKIGNVLDKEQQEIEKESGDVSTQNPVIDAANSPKESAKKDWKILFTSGTSGTEDPTTGSPADERRIYFFNHANEFKNRPYLRSILVTINQEKGLGLEGLVATTNEISTDPAKGNVLSVFVEMDGSDLFYVDKEGKRLGKVGEPTDINQVVFQTMPTASLTWLNGEDRFRKDQAEEAANAAAQWEAERNKIFKYSGEDVPAAYEFDISRGLAQTSDEDNHVAGTLAPATEISTNRTLITIPTTGGIAFNGVIYNYPNGRPLLTYGDVIQFLDNKNLSANQAETAFLLLKDMYKQFNADIAAGVQTPKLNESYRRYLQNVMYWKSGDEQGGNQIYINPRTMEFHIGEKRYSLAYLDRDKTAIMEDVQAAFHNVNNYRLTKMFDEKFTEWYTDNGKLASREWINYQTYLLSNTYPDGSSRNIDNTPLTTNVVKPSEAAPNNFVQKYVILKGIEFSAPAPKVVPDATKSTLAPTQDPANFDYSGNVNSFPATRGNFEFTVSVKNGSVELESIKNSKANDALFKASAKDDAFMTAVVSYLKEDTDQFREKKDDESVEQYNQDLAAIYYADVIASKIKLYQDSLLEPAEQEIPSAELEVLESQEQEVELLNTADLRRPNGSIGTQGFTEENMYDVINFIAQQQGINLPIYDNNAGTSKLKQLIDFLKSNEDAKNKVFEYVKRDPVKAQLLPDGTYYIQDGNHRANLLNLIGVEQIPIESTNTKTEQQQKAEGIANAFESIGAGVAAGANAKIQEYADRIINGESRDSVLQGASPSFVSAVDAIVNSANKGADFSDTPASDDYRRVGEGEKGDRISKVELELFKKWAQENLPIMPYEVLDNLIRTYDNQEAWGALEKGVVKIFRGALRGTEYHEAFHFVFNGFLSKADQEAMFTEFRSNTGSFIDRASGKRILYSEATDKQIEERIADDFADFRIGKLPINSLSAAVRKLFKAIVDFFKSFGVNAKLKNELFNAIDTGKFKEQSYPSKIKSKSTRYSRRINGLTPAQINGFVQDMTARVGGMLNKDNKSLFNFGGQDVDAIFEQIKAEYTIGGDKSKLALLNKVNPNAFNQLKERTIETLRTYRIKVDSDNVVDTTNDDNNKNDYTTDIFSLDAKKTANPAVKLLVGTLIETDESAEGNTSLKLPKAKMSASINGYKLVNSSRAFATVLSETANSADIYKFLDKLAELAKRDSVYVRLLNRLKGDMNKQGKKINFDKLSKEDFRLLVNFFQDFNKQQPNAYIQKVDGDQTYTRSANVSDAVKETQNQWIQNMINIAKEPGSIVGKDSINEAYRVKNPIFTNQQRNNPVAQLDYLNKLGITFSSDAYAKLNKAQLNTFNNAFLSIYDTLAKDPFVVSIRGNTLQLAGQFESLAKLYVNVTNPLRDNTLYGVNGKKKQVFVNNNAPSYFESVFNSVKTLDELLKTLPQLTDVFSGKSQVLKKGGIFFDINGNRIEANKLKVSYIDGVDNINTGKSTPTAKLSESQRFITEINQNLNGNFYVLIPADSVTEWMMNLGTPVTYARLTEVVDGVNMGMQDAIQIFKGYLVDEIRLAQDFENRSKLKNVGDKAKELRFFKEILDAKMVGNITTELIDTQANVEEIEAYIKANPVIDTKIQSYLDGIVNETLGILKKNNTITYNANGETYNYKSLEENFAKRSDIAINKNKLTEDEVRNILTYSRINALIANMEYHKILFGDPLQFEIKEDNGRIILDELKRIKSFLSGRKITVDFDEFNTHLHKEYNFADKDEAIKLQPGDVGYQNFKPYAKTATIKEVLSASELANLSEELKAYGKSKEADASSIISLPAFKEVKLKNGEWGPNAEAWYQWQQAYARQKINKYSNDAHGEQLSKHDAELFKTDEPEFKLEILKPSVSGNKYNKNNIDVVLDKFSQMPIYYKAVEGKTLEKVFLKLHNEGYDYIILQSGRKVGIEGMHEMYEGGEFNDAPYSEVDNAILVPWSSYGIQVENQYSDKAIRRVSQLTKNSTVNLYDNGKAISPAAEKLVKKDAELLKKMTVNGYKMLLNKFGITDMGTTFTVADKRAVSKALYEEMIKLGLDDNAVESITLDDNGEFIIPFEASNSYKKIRDILYSIVHDTVVAPRMSGSANVQAPATGWEDAKKGRTLLLKKDGKWAKITKDEYNALSPADKENVRLGSDALKFYTRDEPWCEILVPHWFKDKFDKSRFPTDESILKYLNDTKEGQNILRGIGSRIPHQALNATESFRVKGFLPQAMGKTVVVPSEIVTKAGSDFDVDKLNLYLKAVYVDRDGNVKLVKLKDSEQATKAYYAKEFDAILNNNKAHKEKALLKVLDDINIIDAIIYNEDSLNPDEDLEERLLKSRKRLDSLIAEYGDIFEDAADYLVDVSNKLRAGVNKLNDATLQANLKEIYINRMYKQALENAYYDNLEAILALPENFDQLIATNDDDTLSKLANSMDVITGEAATEDKIKTKVINPNFLTKLRNYFAEAKGWVGIIAVNITNNSVLQKTLVTLDPAKFMKVPESEQRRLGNLQVLLPHNTVMVNGERRITLSQIKDAEGNVISAKLSAYMNAVVDVAKDPYIMKLIRSTRVVNLFMYLERIGVPPAYTAMFMNQPIIRDYIDQLDENNVGSLFNRQQLNILYQQYNVNGYKYRQLKKGGLGPRMDGKSLQDNIQTILSKQRRTVALSEEENMQQRLVMDEFLKYATMAQHLSTFMRSLSYDTTKFRSVEDMFRKQELTEKTRRYNLFSSVDDVLDNSFIGDIVDSLDNISNAFGDTSILRFNKPEFKKIYLNQVLKPYANNQYLRDEDYQSIANKLSASFLDYIIQTNSNLNIKELLVDETTAVANQLSEARKKFPNMQILQELYLRSPDKTDATKSVQLAVNLKETYDNNLYIEYMRELRDNPATTELYEGIVKVAILQGSYTSPISIKNIIPIEDYARQISPIIESLTADARLQGFADLASFQKNKFKDGSITPQYLPKFTSRSYMQTGDKELDRDMLSDLTMDVIPSQNETEDDIYQVKSLDFVEIPELGVTERSKQVLVIDSYDKASGYEVITVPKLVEQDNVRINIATNETMSKAAIARLLATGNRSMFETYGYQQVKELDGSPFIIQTGEESYGIVYKLVNLLGDGMYTTEYYDHVSPSVTNNGTVKTEELSDNDIINYFSGTPMAGEGVTEDKTNDPTSEVAPTQAPVVEIVDRYTDADVKANPDKIYVFGDNTKRVGTGGQAQIRNNPNAMGIATKIAPSMEEYAFMNDADLDNNKAVIDSDIASIKSTGKPVVFPKDGLGTGLAKLQQKAPQTYAYLKQRLLKEFGFDNDSGTIKSSEAMTTPSGKITLNDGNSYSTSDINSGMLEAMGYKPKEIGTILKSICI